MPKSKGRAGRNIRLLAFSRRYKAVYAFVGAGFIVYMPFALAKLIEGFRSLFTDTNPELAESPAMPVVVYGVAIALAIYLVINGIRLWKGADRADQGAKGEEDVANELRELAASGWQIEYGQRLGKGLGDIDIICVSPRGKTYAIDVKSLRCTVVTDGKKLYRRMGEQRYSFEKVFLSQVTKQALQVKKKRGVKFVTPIVVFSNARVAISANKVKHVHVVEKPQLVSLLTRLG